jgi:hypothetical protein
MAKGTACTGRLHVRHPNRAAAEALLVQVRRA